jgi:hypothetical protein
MSIVNKLVTPDKGINDQLIQQAMCNSLYLHILMIHLCCCQSFGDIFLN